MGTSSVVYEAAVEPQVQYAAAPQVQYAAEPTYAAAPQVTYAAAPTYAAPPVTYAAAPTQSVVMQAPMEPQAQYVQYAAAPAYAAAPTYQPQPFPAAESMLATQTEPYAAVEQPALVANVVEAA